MRIAGAHILPFRLRLAVPLGGAPWREGLLLRLESDDGIVGLGEASPAPWVGDESVSVARESLRRLTSFAGEVTELEAIGASLVPSARSALETALLDLEARMRGVPLTACLGGEAMRVEVSALVTGETPAEVARAAAGRVAEGFRTIKLKVGSGRSDRDRVAALRDAVGANVALRLDANRAWDVSEAGERLAALAPFRPSFVEEPLRAPDPESLARIRAAAGIAVALDESVRRDGDLRRFLDRGAADVLVLKAARVGGPRAAISLARTAVEAGVSVVVTDSIESVVGRRLAIHLAAAMPGSAGAVGLGGAVVLEEDVVPAVPAGVPFESTNGVGLGIDPGEVRADA